MTLTKNARSGHRDCIALEIEFFSPFDIEYDKAFT